MIILLALLVIVGIEGMISFGSNHSYYLAMIFSWKNLALISGAIGSAYLPLSWIRNLCRTPRNIYQKFDNIICYHTAPFQYVLALRLGYSIYRCYDGRRKLDCKKTKTFSRNQMARKPSNLWTWTRNVPHFDANSYGYSDFL